MAEQAFAKENPGAKLSISKLASLAGVNRSNIYTSHGEVAKRLALKRKSKTSENMPCVKKNIEDVHAPKVNSIDYKDYYHAMLRLNIELNAELASVQIKLEEKTRALKARRVAKC
ncbi:MAG: hypothetical protein RSF42_07505 [Comamonas sp.]